MHLEHGFTINTLAHLLRRFKRLHRVGQWLRRNLWRGIVEGFLELMRWVFLNSTRFGPPLRSFSVYQALRNGYPKTNGRIVAHEQGNPVVHPDSLLVRSAHEQYTEQPWPILWSEHANAQLATQSLAFLKDKRLCIESVYGYKRYRDDPAWRFFRLPPPVKLKGNWTSIVSRWVPTNINPLYTHWLLDALPRLGVLSELPPDTQIIVPSILAPSRRHSLEMLGVWDRCRLTPETHLEVERYFFSPPTSMLDCYNPYAVNFLRTALLPKRDPHYSGPKKFFITRAGYTRNPKNAAAIHDFFTSMGWALVEPADLTFAQQVKLFSEAEAICGTTGSGLTNAVFCQPGCLLVQLAQDFVLDGWLDWISQVVKTDYHFLVCPTGYQRRIELDIAQLREFFRKLGQVR